MNRSLCRILLVLSILVGLSLSCNLGGKKDSEKETNAEVKATATIANTDESKEDLPTLGEERRSEDGGYAYRVIPDYAVESGIGITSMIAPDGSNETGPMIMIIGGKKDEGSTTESVLDNMKTSSTAVTFSNERSVTIDGISGIAADFTGTYGGAEVLGSMAIAVNDIQQISILATAPVERWGEISPWFEAVIQSIRLFEPSDEMSFQDVEPTAAQLSTQPIGSPTEQSTATTVRLWAAYATASSEYGSSDWSASQVTGEPNTFECGDYSTAWAAAEASSQEWLELYYSEPVMPAEVNIYQSYAPNQVVKVELLGVTDGVYVVYDAAPVNVDACPYILSIPVSDVQELVMGIRIYIDQSFHNAWNEIDAVELVGLSSNGSMGTEPQPTLDTAFDYSIFSFTQIPLGQVDPGKFHCEIIQDDQEMITPSSLETQVNLYDVEYQLIASNYEPNIFISIFLPKNYQPGEIDLTEYANATPGQHFTATIALGQQLFYAYDGWMYLDDTGGNFTGGIMFLSAQKDDYSSIVETRCIFNQLPRP